MAEILSGVEVPTGCMFPYAGASAPTDWLLCDGSAVSRTTYAALFAVVGTTYGSGNGSTTFNVPDLRGRVPVGAGTDGATENLYNPARGAKFGDYRLSAHTHTGTTGYMNQNWSHGHSIDGPGGHSHGVNFGGLSGLVTFAFSPSGVWSGCYAGQADFATNTDTNHTHSFTTNNTGAGGSANQPPSLGVNYIIKV